MFKQYAQVNKYIQSYDPARGDRSITVGRGVLRTWHNLFAEQRFHETTM